MQSASIDYAGTVIAQQVRAGLDELQTADNSDALGPIGTAIADLAAATQNIAGMLDLHSVGRPNKQAHR